jgi:hypothetical protein
LVAIDTSGRWWRGSQREDIEAYLAAYTAESYGMKYYRACICACGSTEFSVECKSLRCNAGVGYAGYDDDPTGIKWIYVGVRCAQCGVLGCFAEWKVALSDALNLLDKA